MKKFRLLFLPVSILFFLTGARGAFAIPIDLTTFDASFPLNVAVTADGSSALFSEDAVFSPIELSYTGFTLPANAAQLHFDYELDVPAGNDDYFDFYFDDLGTPIFTVGGPEHSSFGSYSLNLLPYAGGSVDMVFSLAFDFGDVGLDSTLLISNVEIVERQIPLPSTILLFFAGLLGLLGIKQKPRT